MPDIEKIASAIDGLKELHGKITDYMDGTIVRGEILQSNMPDDGLVELAICLDTALQVLEKRLEYHTSPSLDVERMAKALS